MSFLRKIFLIFVILSAIFAGFIIKPCYSEIKIPQPVGYVNDFAGIISETDVKKLNGLLYELKYKTGAEIAVVTLKSLEGYPIEEVSLKIGRDWKVGQIGKKNGVVILVVPADRKMRIEVVYALESVITDAKAGRIRDNYMIPYFKSGNYSDGIIYGTSAVISEIAKGYGVEISGNYNPPVRNTDNPPSPFAVFLIIFLIIAFSRRGFVFLPLYGGSFASSGGFGGGSSFGGFGGGGDFGGGGASGDW